MFLWSYVQKAFLLSSRRLLGRRGAGCLLGCHCYSSASCPPPQLLPLICISHLYPWSTLLLTFLDYIFLTSAVHLFLTTVHCLFLYHPSNRLLFYHAPCMALCLFCCAPPMNDKCLCAAHWGTQAHRHTVCAAHWGTPHSGWPQRVLGCYLIKKIYIGQPGDAQMGSSRPTALCKAKQCNLVQLTTNAWSLKILKFKYSCNVICYNQ